MCVRPRRSNYTRHTRKPCWCVLIKRVTGTVRVLCCMECCPPRYRDGAARRATAWRHGPTFIIHSRAPKQRLTCATDPGYTHIHTCASERSHLSNPHSDTPDRACVAALSCLRWPWTRAAGLVHSPTHHARSAHGLAAVRARVVCYHASRTLPR